MPNATDARCPTWCDKRHNGDPLHFALLLEREIPDRSGVHAPADVIVTVRQHLVDEERPETGPLLVEIELPSNSGLVDLTWLSPDEASQVGLALIAAAAKAASGA